MEEKPDRGGGDQVAERICAGLRATGLGGSGGVRLSEIAAATGLSRPAAHRFLTTPTEQDFVRRTAAPPTGAPGPA